MKKEDLFRKGQVCFRDRSSADKRVMEKGWDRWEKGASEDAEV